MNSNITKLFENNPGPKVNEQASMQDYKSNPNGNTFRKHKYNKSDVRLHPINRHVVSCLDGSQRDSPKFDKAPYNSRNQGSIQRSIGSDSNKSFNLHPKLKFIVGKLTSHRRLNKYCPYCHPEDGEEGGHGKDHGHGHRHGHGSASSSPHAFMKKGGGVIAH